MQPSESSRSKLTRVARRSAASRSGAGRSTSVVMTTSMVARPGASIPAPFAMPPIAQPSPRRSAVFGTLSVVMMARAASIPPSAPSAAAAAVTPARRRSRSSCSPMRPVEQTSTSPAPTSSASATASAVACVVWKPCAPVKQLAPPELRTIAATSPSAIACCDQMMGLAFARLLVNTAAAARRGPRLTMRARSAAPELFNPQATPAASKPAGAVTVTGRLRRGEGRASRAVRARC